MCRQLLNRPKQLWFSYFSGNRIPPTKLRQLYDQYNFGLVLSLDSKPCMVNGDNLINNRGDLIKNFNSNIIIKIV